MGLMKKILNKLIKMQKILIETGADAVKLEGGEKLFDTITFLTKKKLM